MRLFFNIVVNQNIGVIFYQNEEGDVTDIQADIIGPGKYQVEFEEYVELFSSFTFLLKILDHKKHLNFILQSS